MENLSTPIPLPKLNILRASELNDKKSSLKKQLTSGSRSCPRVPNKNSSCKFLTFSPKSARRRNTRPVIHTSNSVGSVKDCSVNGNTDEKQESFSSSYVYDRERGIRSRLRWSNCNSGSLCHTLTPKLVSFSRKNDDGNLDVAEENDVVRDKFELIEKLGSGSFGEVYKVRELNSDKLFALKKSRERFKGANDRKRKLEEVRKMETMGQHDNCVRFFRAWEENRFLFIQTELCYTTLSKLISESEDQRIDEEESWLILFDMLHALDHLSLQSLVHLDIKPVNIFVGLSQPPLYKLGDFGLMVDVSTDVVDPEEGDPKYLALEVLSEVYTTAADIFSLGATLLDCVTSIDLPRSGHWWQLLRESLRNLPGEFLRQMSDELVKVIEAMMLKDHCKRPSAGQLLRNSNIQQRTAVTQRRQFNRHPAQLDLGASPMKRIRLDSSSSSSASSPKRELSFKPEKETMMTSETTGSERTTEMVFSDQKDFSLTFCGRGSEFISFSNFSCLVRASTRTVSCTRKDSNEDSGILGVSSQSDGGSSPEQEGAGSFFASSSSNHPLSSTGANRHITPSSTTIPSSIVTPTTSPRIRPGSSASSEGFCTPSLTSHLINPSSCRQLSIEISPRKCSSSSESLGSEFYSDDDVMHSDPVRMNGPEMIGVEDEVFSSSETNEIKDSLLISAEGEIESPTTTPPVHTGASNKRSANRIYFEQASSRIVFESAYLTKMLEDLD